MTSVIGSRLFLLYFLINLRKVIEIILILWYNIKYKI